MTSERRIAANRANARRSTGPRTAAGKLRAIQNARRHGLAAVLRAAGQRTYLESVATALCAGDSNPQLFEQALVIAQVDQVRRCVANQRVLLIERLRDPAAKPL